MNWKQFWQQQRQTSNPLLQVGRKGGLAQQPDDWLAEYAAYVAKQLNLTQEDVLLDVCCGNGMLTHHLAKHCKAVLGIDFSQSHIDYANKHYALPMVAFTCADALQLGSFTNNNDLFNKGLTKASLCFSFQYFESVPLGLKVVEGIFKLKPHHLFLGDIPDRDKFFVYYNSPRKLLRLIKQILFQQNDMGKFWSEQELAFIAQKVGAKAKKIDQPITFPYAHYRMDYLLITS
jgi:SAM-dependent methyltransferase